MTREELNILFNEFVLRNAPRSSSFLSIKASSKLCDLKNRMDKIPYAGAEQVAKMILEERDAICAVVVSIKHPDYLKERDAANKLIEICDGLQPKS